MDFETYNHSLKKEKLTPPDQLLSLLQDTLCMLRDHKNLSPDQLSRLDALLEEQMQMVRDLEKVAEKYKET